MSLTPGTRLGAYEIVALIGAGGMGEVYRARDIRLQRDVAIKVLPEMFSADAERLARFKREAHVLASLNHPNIASVHGLEETTGGNALVLELVEGPTLADVIASHSGSQSRGIPIDDALPIARQIAEALEAAHEHGIVHRDLKPANIKITNDGQVKVLDFGLAKAAAPTDGSTAGHYVLSDMSASPTITSPAMTHGGVILGTAAYMSPEQAKGKPVDRRTDMWAFGCVLYEMLTGTRAFAGEDVSDTLAEILKGEPDLKKLPRDTPPSIVRLLRRCFTKDRKARLSDAGVARIEIDEAATAQPAVPPSMVPARKQRAAIVASVLVSAVVAATIGAATAIHFRPEPPRSVRRFAIELPPDQLFAAAGRRWLALSPDGSRLVYIASQRLNMRQMSSLETSAFAGTNTASLPLFSPDSRWLAFWQNGQLKKMDVSGGPAIRICEMPVPYGARWEDDDAIWFGKGADGIWKVSAEAGSTPVQVIKLDAAKAQTAELPQLLPGRDAVLFTLNTGGMAQAVRAQLENAQIVVQSLRTGERKTVVTGGADGHYLSSGHIAYLRQGALVAAPFALDRLAVTGTAETVVDELVQAAGGVGVTGGGISSAGQFTMSSEGTLAYFPRSILNLDRNLVWVDRAGIETPIAAPTRAYVYPRISPDGTRIALDIRDESQDIHIWDISRAILTKLTFDPGPDIAPLWSPDGRRIAFAKGGGDGRGVFSVAADGTGPVEPLAEEQISLYVPSSFTPDGSRLLVSDNQGSTYDIKAINVGGERSVKSVLDSSFSEQNPALSPDGRWMAYQSNESGQYEIYVRPFPDVKSGRWQISSGGGTRPAWRGQEIFYLAPPVTMMVVPVSTGTGFTYGNAVKLFSGSYVASLAGRTYDVTSDGKKFLMLKMTGQASTAPGRIVIVQNWMEALARPNP